MDHVLNEIVELRSDLRRSVDALRSELRQSIDALRSEMAAFRAEVRHDIAELRETMDRRFMWLVGIQVAGLVAVIAALVRS